MLETIGPTLVCSAITDDTKFQRQLIDATHIDRLNIGPMPTIKLNWLQPHEGSIVDFLFRARAFQFDDLVAGSDAAAAGTGVPLSRTRCRLLPPDPTAMMSPNGFHAADHPRLRVQVVFGAGALARLGEIVQRRAAAARAARHRPRPRARPATRAGRARRCTRPG